MEEIVAKAQSMGATDAVIQQWLDIVDPGFGMTPRQLVADGRAADVLDILEQMGEGVFG